MQLLPNNNTIQTVNQLISQPKKQLNTGIRNKINFSLKLKITDEQNDSKNKKNNFEFTNDNLPILLIQDDLKIYDEYYKDYSYFNVSMKKCNTSIQEDRYVAYPFSEDEAFFGVFDGHSTTCVADYLVQQLYQKIKSNIHYDKDVQKSIKEVYAEVDSELQNLLQSQNQRGGSTALCALIKKDMLYLINLGDSTAIMINNDKPIKLNTEHSVMCPEEKLRIEEMGGFILKDRVLGGLQVTRTFGDIQYKPYVIAEPDILEYKLSNQDEYLILGTDGFWNALDIKKSLDFVVNWKKTNSPNKINNLSFQLIQEAFQAKIDQRKDNMTLIVIDIGCIYKYQTKSPNLSETSFLESISTNNTLHESVTSPFSFCNLDEEKHQNFKSFEQANQIENNENKPLINCSKSQKSSYQFI